MLASAYRFGMEVIMAKWFVAAKKADFNKIAKEFGISPVSIDLKNVFHLD